MPAFSYIRRLTGGAAVVLLLGTVAACGGTRVWHIPLPTPIVAPTPSPTPTPTPSPTPTPMSTLDSFKARIASIDFQAQGPVVGSIAATTILGPTSGSVTGTFKVRGGDSAFSIAAKILGFTATNDLIVVGDWSYSRTNGGQWTKAAASGKTLQGFVGSGIVLFDEYVEAKLGRQLHHLTVVNMAGVDLSSLGISAGSGLENLSVSSLAFWAQDDGTPAGVTVQASFDQKVLGTPTHETVTLDITIDTLSGVTITAPTT